MAITSDQIRQLKSQGYDKWASWAIWDPKEPDPTIPTLEEFCLPYTDNRLCWAQDKINNNPEKYLRNDIVIIGLNVSTKCEEWSNFHLTTEQIGRNKKNNRQVDRRLRYLLDKSPYCGAYMTDLVKEVAGNGSEELNRLNDDSFRTEQFEILFEELKTLEVNDKTIFIFLGDKIKAYFRKFNEYLTNTKPVTFTQNPSIKIKHCSLHNDPFESDEECDLKYVQTNWQRLKDYSQKYENPIFEIIPRMERVELMLLGKAINKIDEMQKMLSNRRNNHISRKNILSLKKY